MASSRGTQNGPDWTDVTAMMEAVQELHSVGVTLLMSPDGMSGSSVLRVTAVATLKEPRGLVANSSVSRWRKWPSRDAKTFEGLVYRLLHEIDRDCGQFWHQGELLF